MRQTLQNLRTSANAKRVKGFKDKSRKRRDDGLPIDVNLGFDKISKEHRLEDLMDYLTRRGSKKLHKVSDDDYSTEEYIGWLSDDQIKRVFWLSDDIDNDSETLNGLVSHRPELALEVSLTNKASFLLFYYRKTSQN